MKVPLTIDMALSAASRELKVTNPNPFVVPVALLNGTTTLVMKGSKPWTEKCSSICFSLISEGSPLHSVPDSVLQTESSSSEVELLAKSYKRET